MRLLFIVPYAPTPIRTRPYAFLKQLGARGHNITLATLYSSADERRSLDQWHAPGIKVIAAPLPRTRSVWNVARAFFTTIPLQAVFCWQPELARQLTQLLAQEPFDACHVEHLRGALYARHVQHQAANTGRGVRIVWDSVDCISALFEQSAAYSRSLSSRLTTRLELGRTRAFEPAMVNAFDVTTVVTEPERTALLDLAGAGANRSPTDKVKVVPNGVDTEYFRSTGGARETATVLFSGKMSYHANFTAASVLLDEIMPRVWLQVPEARVVIVGQGPSSQLLERAKADPRRIVVTGEVPDIRPYMERATVACAPMVYGVGVQNKILEAMAMQVPVVTSELAARALPMQDGCELLVGGDVNAISAQLVRALQDNELRSRLAKNAYTFVKTHMQWRASVELLESIYLNRTN